MGNAPKRIWTTGTPFVGRGVYQESKPEEGSRYKTEYVHKDIADKEKQEVTKHIKEVRERFNHDKNGGFKHCDTHGNTLYWLDKVLFAIDQTMKDLGGK